MLVEPQRPLTLMLIRLFYHLVFLPCDNVISLNIPDNQKSDNGAVTSLVTNVTHRITILSRKLDLICTKINLTTLLQQIRICVLLSPPWSHPQDVKINNVGSWSSLAKVSSSGTKGAGSAKSSASNFATSFQMFQRQAKEKEERVC